MAIEALLLPAVTALFLMAIVVRISGLRDWYEYEPVERSGGVAARALEWAWESPVAWTLGFLALTVSLSVGAILAVNQGSIAGAVLQLLLVMFGVALALYVFFGTYFSIRSRGAKSSIAAALSSLLMGFLILLVVSLRLAGLV